MGFRLNRTYRLVFEGGMEGAEVVFSSTPVSVALEIGGEVGYDRIAELFGLYVVEWNLETADGEPLKVEKAAILDTMERPIMARIMREWFKAAAGISAPLDGPSTSGGQSPEESIPMETL